MNTTVLMEPLLWCRLRPLWARQSSSTQGVVGRAKCEASSQLRKRQAARIGIKLRRHRRDNSGRRNGASGKAQPGHEDGERWSDGLVRDFDVSRAWLWQAR